MRLSDLEYEDLDWFAAREDLELTPEHYRRNGIPRFIAVDVPLMSLLAILDLDMDAVASDGPYLHADPDAVANWRARLARMPGLKVGLTWAGDPRRYDRTAFNMDRRRSITLERLAPLLAVPGVTFVSLQKGEAAAQAAGLPIVDWTAELDDFADTAALIAALDLVISVDTSIVHAAGALGRPVWVLNRFDRCWRWMWDRTDTPWYQTMRLFTQTTPGVWDDVVAEVAASLRQSANGTVQAS
ncbi:MAG: glycosyltransferase family 9 protein [Rhodopila sp.]|nr:glycosyltransferase family 9 protein [Rhodopila sp.]